MPSRYSRDLNLSQGAPNTAPVVRGSTLLNPPAPLISADASGTLTLVGASGVLITDQANAAGTLPIAGVSGAAVQDVASAAGALTLGSSGTAAALDQVSASGTLLITGSASAQLLDVATAQSPLALMGAADTSALVIGDAAGVLPIAGQSDVLTMTPVVADASGLLVLIGEADASITDAVLVQTGGGWGPSKVSAVLSLEPDRPREAVLARARGHLVLMGASGAQLHAGVIASGGLTLTGAGDAETDLSPIESLLLLVAA